MHVLHGACTPPHSSEGAPVCLLTCGGVSDPHTQGATRHHSFVTNLYGVQPTSIAARNPMHEEFVLKFEHITAPTNIVYEKSHEY